MTEISLEKLWFVFQISFIFAKEFGFFLFHLSRKLLIRRLAYNLAKKNILYVKLFQAVAMNKNMIDDETNNELLRFMDTAPYVDSDINVELLMQIKNDYHLSGYSSNEPIKSGMISLIYKFHNEQDNTDVILKLKRNNIEEKLNIGIENLKFFVYLLSFIPYLNALDFTSVFNKNIKLLKEQLDFKQEIRNMIDSQENCKYMKYIKIPYVYESVTEKYPDVIMMEFIDGKTIQEIEDEDYTIYANFVMKYGIASTLVHGLTHGDLHAGNILFIKNDDFEQKHQIALIDFGVVLRSKETERRDFYNVSSKFFSIPPRETTILVLTNFIEPKNVLDNLPKVHFDSLIDAICPIVEEAFTTDTEVTQAKLYKCILQFNNYIVKHSLSKYGLRLNDFFVKLQMGLAMCNAINMVLCKNNVTPFLKVAINELFHADLLEDDK
jgi:predicted unusual protein kinase regulating ubiquinone biosynthesis (AarF/ABC1/UbiB family)